MKHTGFFKRFLSMMLILAIMAGNVLPCMALEVDAIDTSGISFTRVDNSMVSAGLSPNGQTEITADDLYAPTDVVRVSIILEKQSTIKAGFSAMNIASNQAATNYRNMLKKEQTSMVARIEKAIGSDLDVVWNLTLAANLISANVQYGQIEAIKKLPGVKTVILENQYLPCETQTVDTIIPNMATSGDQIGTSPVWAEGYTGAGTRIAVIDTGIDTNHQSMNGGAFEYALAQIAAQKGMTLEAYMETLDLLDAEEIAAVASDLNVPIQAQSAYLNSKLPFVFNYKDLDYDVTHDNDDQGDHGSHVAGIATANSYIVGQDGNYYNALETVQMQGVAPEAQLLAMKVFGKNGSPYDSDFFAAIEDAIILGADSINMSLGSTAPGRGHHNNAEFEAIMEDLEKSGVVVAVSAGNSGSWVENADNGGYLYNTDVSMDTVGQPGSFTNSLCVASVENDGMVGYYFTVGNEMIVYIEELFNSMQSFTTIAGEHEYIFIDGVGDADDWAAVADVLPGKIAICSRGEINFTEKARLAVEAGAVAVLIYNNQSGIIYLDMTEYYQQNPVASLTKAQGAIIRENSTPVTDADGNVLYLTGKMTISDTIGKGSFNSEYYTMSDFSSWGVPGTLEMKPEITAPGGNIYSLEGLDPSGGAYAIKSGTSMASPQVAGMAALLAQYIAENNLVDKTGLSARQLAQSLLMSTAEPILEDENTYFSILQQGAGLANINNAIHADSYIMMAASANSGAADGKVKVELFDDPDKTGSYRTSFTICNLENEAKTLELNADFFVQSLISDGSYLYMDVSTMLIGMNVKWTIGGKTVTRSGMSGADFNGDGVVNAADGQLLLDYATGKDVTLANYDRADIDGDGDVDSHDAYLFLRDLTATSAVLPAGGSVQISVEFSMTSEMKQMLDAYYPNGTYVQGFLYAETEETSHSIPVLGFYGNWTDPSMFDVGSWPTYDTGEDTRIPYTGILRGNDFQVRYANNPNYHYSLGGNPLIADDTYMPERNAINSGDTIHGIKFVPIRHADQSRVLVVNETTGEVLLERETGPVNMAYYPNEIYGWQNANMILETGMSLKDTTEGDMISVAFSLAPEYYVDSNGNVDWDAMGDGATMRMDLVIDNTAPELLGVSIDVLNNTMTITASDNQYIAAAGLYNKTGTRRLAATGAKQDIEKGEVAEYTFSLEGINGKKFLVQVHDYAMNTATYLIEMQIGEETGIPDMMAFDLVARHWTTFTKDFVYDYKVGTPRLEYADHVYYAATIAEHYVFASTNQGDLYVMPEDDLSDTTFIVDMGVVLYDMAYNKADGNIYGVTEANNLVVIDKLSGELTKIGSMPKRTNTLACSPEGVFYFNELGTGKIWSFTLETMDAPQLLMEDPFLTREDPIYGDHNGTEGNMGMEYDPNRNLICWNSHLEVLIGSYITFAYYYEIDPKTGEFTRYNDFWHEMSCLMIPDETGRNNGWAEPTDKVSAVSLNKTSIEVIKGTSATLVANVQPWTATNRDVTWSSADTSIAVVDSNGVVTGIAPGTTTITATSKLDPTKSATCEVSVELLNVTISGTLMDESDNAMLYSWNMAKDDTWTPGKSLPVSMTSATYSAALDVFYIMDTTDALQMHKVHANGNLLASADNENNIPLWDMAYSETFSTAGAEKVTSIYYSYLLSAKDPMALDAVGFDLGSMCSYLVGITTLGSEQVEDTEGNVHDTEHLVMLDNDGYIWHFWVYAREGGGFDALYSINKSNLELELPGYDSMEHMFTSLMADDNGNLYLAAFTGETSELYYLTYDEIEEQYLAVKIGEMGEDVWPATITSVTVNDGNATNAAAPAPKYTMSATTIRREELAAASTKVAFTVTEAEKNHKLGLTVKADEIVVNGDGTQADPIELVAGTNTGVAPTTGTDKYCYFTFTAGSAGTVTITTTNTDWRANYFINAVQANTNLINPKYDGTTITCDLQSGDVFMLMISPYISYKYGGEITFDFQFSGEGGTTPDPTCQHTNTETKTENEVAATCTEDGSYDTVVYCTDCGAEVSRETTTVPATGHSYADGTCANCGEADPDAGTEPNPNDTLVLGENALASGTVYTYTATEAGRLEFDFTVKDSNGTAVYQYAYGKGTRVKIMINGKYAANLADTRVTVAKGQTVTVELVSVDGDAYTATLTMSALEAANALVLGDNNITKNTDYSFIATQDGTLYTTIKELWYDGTYCSEASLSSTIVFKINGVGVSQFQNAYEVKAGDEITVTMGLSFGDDSASAVLNLSYEGFYNHPAGSRGNPYILNYADCPTTSVEIAAGEAVWYKLSGFGSGAQLTVKGQNAYVIVGSTRYDAVDGSLTISASTNIQIGNAGTEDAAFELSASIQEGYAGNPKDLVNGDNIVEVAASGNYYYDFVATQAGTATFTVSGDNWRFWYSLIAADGTALVDAEDHQAKRSDAATITVELATGQSILLKLGTLNSSWSAPGGEITVTFQFTPAEGACAHTNTEIRDAQTATCAKEGYTGDTWCLDCGIKVKTGETIEKQPHTPGAEATCTTAQVCTVCSEELAPATGHSYVDGKCENCGEAEPVVNPEYALVLGTNELVSGNKYTYVVTEEGRLEFDFVIKDSDGKTIYSYAYGKGTRVKIMINGSYVPNLENTKISVSVGDVVTVELASVDGGSYTATLTMTALAPATKLVLGDNNVAKDTDYSFIATKDGTLYITVKELWCDGVYCSEASMSSSVVFKINGVVVSKFENSYEVKTGDEITVLLGTSFDEPANAVLNLSYEGFYKHPAGSRGNPYVVSYTELPTTTVQIPAGEAVWYKFTGFPAGGLITIQGTGAYIIVSGQTLTVPAEGLTISAVTNMQIGNAGTAAASFQLSASIQEGYAANPKDLVEGDNTVELDKSANYYYDFVATQDGTVTVTVSGDNWRFWFSHFAADGSAIVSEEDHRAARGDEATVTLALTAGQSIVIKLGTMTSSWTAPGGEITVSFHFEPAQAACQHTNTKTETENEVEATCTADGSYDTVVYCADCGAEMSRETITVPATGHSYENGSCTSCGEADPNFQPDPETTLVLGKNDLTSGITYTYVVPADGRMEFTVGSVYNSAGSKQYSWYNGSKVQILINGKAMTASSTKFNVKAGQIITVLVNSLDGDTYTTDMTLKELTPAESLVIGNNDLNQNLEYVYVAEKDGTVYVSVVEMLYNGAQVTADALGDSVQMTINGKSVSSFTNSYAVKAGDEIAIIIKDYSWSGDAVISAVVNLSYEGFYEYPVGSLNNPIALLYADCPTESIEIASGSTVWYKLEGSAGDWMTSANYPFKDKYLVVTGAGAYVIVDGTRFDAENGVVKILMGEDTLIQIGNDGSAAAIFQISVEIPEGHKDNPQDLVEGDNKVTLPSYGTYYYDFTAAVDGTVTVTVSGENWKYTFTHYAADGTKLSSADYYAKNGDSDTVTLEIKAGEMIVVMVGTSKGYSQPGGDITVSFHFEPAELPCQHTNTRTEIENEVEATCTEDGSYDEVVYCADCGEELSRKTTAVPAAGHSFEDGVCTECGEADPDALPENAVIVDVTIDVDVTNGVVLVTWDPAKLTLKSIIIHADYSSVLEADGSVTFGYVALNGIAAGESIATLVFEAVDPADANVTIKHKQINNESNEECEHIHGDPVIENEIAASCTADGSYDTVIYCALCGEEISRQTTVVPATGHSYDVIVVEPTCLEGGCTVYICVCGDSYVENYVAALGHDMVQHEAKEPTCTESGWEAYEDCSRCDYSTCQEIPATEHNYDSVLTEPTCTEDGFITYTCVDCGDTYVKPYLKAQGHQEVIDEAVAPTCTEDGLTEGSHCSVCGEVLTEQTEIPANGHVDENKDFYCDVCGEDLCTEHVLEAIPEKLPTCTEDGLTQGIRCANCGEIIVAQEVIPALGHSYGEGVVTKEATCTETGVMTYTCACGHSYTEEIPMNDHNFVGGECTECGEKTMIVLGDVNGDGFVNTSDAKLIMQYDLGMIDETGLILSVADVNGDGFVDTTDAKLIMQLDLGLITEFFAP